MIPTSLKPSTAFVAACLITSCAHQIPPSGGPRDVEGPRVVWSYPEPYSLNVTTDRIEIEFDEYVDRRSVEESIFISPAIDNIEFEWTGTSVTLSFPGPLSDSTTYVVTVGTDVTDFDPSPRNKMSDAFTLAFSTGDELDSGLLSGRVLPRLPGDELSGVMVYAYNLPGSRADTLNPKTTPPTYTTQAGDDGGFALPHIRLGFYLVFALRDDARDLLYDTEEDEFAVSPDVYRLTSIDTSRTGIVLRLSVEDTTGPFLTGIDSVDRNRIIVEFSEPIDTSSAALPFAIVVDTTTGKEIPAFGLTVDLPDRKKGTVTTDFLDPEKEYLLRLSGLRDVAGNVGPPHGLSRMFIAPSGVDTLLPAVRSLSVRDSSTDVKLEPRFALSFSQAMLRSGWRKDRVTLARASDRRPVLIGSRWLTDSDVELRPETGLGSNEWYELSIDLYGLTDWRLRPVGDSMRVVRFRTLDVDAFGSIEGRVIAAGGRDTSGPLIVRAIAAGKVPEEILAGARPDGSFSLRFLSPGRYVLSAFRDRNGNGEHDSGLPHPLKFGEAHSMPSDSLRVRPRWPLEGALLRIP